MKNYEKVVNRIVLFLLALYILSPVDATTTLGGTLFDGYDKSDLIVTGLITITDVTENRANILIADVLKGSYVEKTDLTVEFYKDEYVNFDNSELRYLDKKNMLIFLNYDQSKNVYIIPNLYNDMRILKINNGETWIANQNISVSELKNSIIVRNKLTELSDSIQSEGDFSELFKYLLSENFLKSDFAAHDYLRNDFSKLKIDDLTKWHIRRIMFYELLLIRDSDSKKLSIELARDSFESFAVPFLINKIEAQSNDVNEYMSILKSRALWRKYGGVDLGLDALKETYMKNENEIKKNDALRVLSFFESEHKEIKIYANLLLNYIYEIDSEQNCKYKKHEQEEESLFDRLFNKDK